MPKAVTTPTTRFHNMSDAALADAIGRADAIAKGRRAELAALARAALVMAERDRDGMISTNGASEDLAWSALSDVVGIAWDDPLLPAGTA